MSNVNLVITEENGTVISVSDHKYDTTRLLISVNKPNGVTVAFSEGMYNAIMGVYAYKNNLSIFDVIDAGYSFADNLAQLLLEKESVSKNINFNMDLDKIKNMDAPVLKYLRIGKSVDVDIDIRLGAQVGIGSKSDGFNVINGITLDK